MRHLEMLEVLQETIEVLQDEERMAALRKGVKESAEGRTSGSCPEGTGLGVDAGMAHA